MESNNNRKKKYNEVNTTKGKKGTLPNACHPPNTPIEESFAFDDSEWSPQKYQLQLTFDKSPLQFTGTVNITIDCKEQVKGLSFDAITTELQVIEATVQQGKWKGTCKPFEEASQKKVKLVLSEPLGKGRANVILKFRGNIREDGLGVYKCVRGPPFDKEFPLIVSHFEPTFASLCFPCIADPAIRTIFSVQISVPEGLTAASCMPIVNQKTEKNGLITFEFDETPIIPSYLLGFAIGAFTAEATIFKSSSGEEIPLKVLVPSGFYSEGLCKSINKTIMNAASLSLHAMESYFDTPYWLPKLDLIAVPHMLLAGMENLGCCFLHVIPPVSPNNNEDLSSVEQDVLHEVAHHWVGNMVGMSMKWKEGIVQHIERVFAEKLFAGSGKKTRKKGQQVRVISKKGSADAMTSQLQKDFCKQLNEEFYQKSLKMVEGGIESMVGGEKTFQQRLSGLVKEFSSVYIKDDVAESILFSTTKAKK